MREIIQTTRARLSCLHKRTRNELDTTGLTRLPATLAIVFACIWIVLFLTALLGVLWTIVATAVRLPTLWQFDPGDLRWFLLTLTALTAALGAIVALPFTLLRTGFAARQTRTAEENLTTDLIYKAVEGLGAQKEVNRLGRTVKFKDETNEPDSAFEWMDERSTYETVTIQNIGDW